MQGRSESHKDNFVAGAPVRRSQHQSLGALGSHLVYLGVGD